MAKPLRFTSSNRSQHQVHQLRVSRGKLWLQKRSPPQIQLRPQENPSSHPADRPICESLIIVEYIDQIWSSGPTLLPSDPYDRALARFWAAYVEQWFPSLRAVLMAEEDDDDRASRVDEAKKGLALFEEALVKCSKGGSFFFFGGEEIGLLDIAFGSFLSWIRVVKIMRNVSLIDEAHTPNLFRWASRFVGHDAVKVVFPDIDKHVEVAKFLVAKAKTGSGIS